MTENKLYEVWEEGFMCQGMDFPEKARLIGKVEASSFKEACDILCANRDQKHYGQYDPVRLMVWGCRLFDNEADARKSFG